MVFRMELTYHEIADILDTSYIAASSTGYALQRSIYEICDTNLILKSLLPDDVKVNVTFDDISLRSNLTTHKTINHLKNLFFSIQY